MLEEVNKGCSEFCVATGTATRTAGILIHSRLKALAVNLSRPSGRLWLYAGLIGSNNPRWLKADLVVCANPSSLGEESTRLIDDCPWLKVCALSILQYFWHCCLDGMEDFAFFAAGGCLPPYLIHWTVKNCTICLKNFTFPPDARSESKQLLTVRDSSENWPLSHYVCVCLCLFCRIIQGYVVRDEGGSLASESSDRAKVTTS